MKFIRWCGLFAIGHPTIDTQHQELFEIINHFQEELTKGASNHLSIEILNELIKYAQKHFSDEEKISREFGFPEEELSNHREVHEQLILDVFQLHQEISKGMLNELDAISDFLANWIILHVLIEDYKYKPYLKNYEKSE